MGESAETNMARFERKMQEMTQEIKELRKETAELKNENVAFKHEIEKVNNTVDAAFRWIDELKSLTKTVHNLALSVQTQTSELTRIAEKQTAMQADLMELKLKPAKRWDSVVTALITGAVGLLLGWLFKGGGN